MDAAAGLWRVWHAICDHNPWSPRWGGCQYAAADAQHNIVVLATPVLDILGSHRRAMVYWA